MSHFVFNPESHQYFLDGVELPSVTTVLKEVGVIDSRYCTEVGRNRGTAVHLACQFLDEKKLDWEMLDPQIKGYVRAYKLFLEQSDFSPELIEQKLFHPTLLYAGTPDRVGTLQSEKTLIDIKTGSIPKWTALQLAAYEHLLDQPCQKYVLQLKKNGNYKLKKFDGTEDINVFLSALSIYQWKKQEGKNSSNKIIG